MAHKPSERFNVAFSNFIILPLSSTNQRCLLFGTLIRLLRFHPCEGLLFYIFAIFIPIIRKTRGGFEKLRIQEKQSREFGGVGGKTESFLCNIA
ncbi:hypothetical protein HMPREF3213_03974 [Heyndrickxia coagulans]|uniref:Uncharacterized protein n=1 Tax=Heyndrickxia coagulans TaxID=1398 RepID=A0A133K9L5_HEYCO|nr:hypothetical protein HMPREF3213_03974 [Heyndrickxia coagulans]